MFLCYLTNLGLSALLVWSGRPFPGAWFWVFAQGLMAFGTFFDALPHGSIAAWWPSVIGNSAYAASNILFLHSVWVFRFRSPFPRWLYAIIVIEFLTFLVSLEQPYWIRSWIFSAWMTLGSLAVGALLIWSVDRNDRLSHWMTSLPFLILGGSSLVRLGIVMHLGPSGGITELTSVNVGYVSGAILLATIILFGYFMMTRTRSEQILSRKDSEIEVQNQQLIESNRAKDLFFSIIAHDLRGPISGSARYVRKHLLGKMTGLEAKYKEVETLASALDKTNDFLEKLLWWSRAQLQDWVPRRVAVDLEPVFLQTLALVQATADLKGIQIVLPQPPLPSPLADPESVQLILGNLLSNAVKFTLTGRTVRISTTVQNGFCQIIVEDEGVGMDAPTLERLFRIEDKLTTHGTSGERGSGLGLLLSKSLAERNNGGITIESEAWVGTRATLSLPMPAQGESSSEPL